MRGIRDQRAGRGDRQPTSLALSTLQCMVEIQGSVRVTRNFDTQALARQGRNTCSKGPQLQVPQILELPTQPFIRVVLDLLISSLLFSVPGFASLIYTNLFATMVRFPYKIFTNWNPN